MKTLLKIPALLYLVVLLGVCGCSSPVTMPSADTSVDATATLVPTLPATPAEISPSVPEATVDPSMSVVLNMIERSNAEDYSAAAAYFADDAMIYLIGMPPSGMEIYRGRDQFQTFLEECCTGTNFVWEVAPYRVENDVVFTESKTWMDFTRSLGVAPNTWHEMFEVKDGKITLYVSTITEEALAKFKPALFQAIPELAVVVGPSTDPANPPATEIDITFADGTCTSHGGLVLQAGDLTVRTSVQDSRWSKYAVTMFTLDEGKDLVDLMASTYRPSPPGWSDMVLYKELLPGDDQTYAMQVGTEDVLYLICWGGSPDTAIGNAGPYFVKE